MAELSAELKKTPVIVPRTEVFESFDVEPLEKEVQEKKPFQIVPKGPSIGFDFMDELKEKLAKRQE